MNSLAGRPFELMPEMVQPDPIECWSAALRDERECRDDLLRAAYQANLPTQGELIFTGACEFSCSHCIYSQDFARHNRTMPLTDWSSLLSGISDDLGINTFVYGGRSLTDAGLDVMTWLRSRFPNAHIGLIDNGISMLPARERLHDVRADWIDISFDGQEADHDAQRGRIGSYRGGLDSALWLVRNGVTPKVNVLSCLTRLNRHSMIPMIQELNDRGFRNFFVVPITVVDSERNMQDLRLSAAEFVAFMEELRAAVDTLDDAWVEVNMFAPEYAQAVARLMPDIWKGFKPGREGLVWYEDAAGSSHTDLFVWYYPTSLTGVRELIINTRGDVIMPKSMARGRVSSEHILGNLLREPARAMLDRLPLSPQFGFYLNEFQNEMMLLEEYI
jgi:MoaA/NifB/PqqE/SkfB family radical SAM enzyme